MRMLQGMVPWGMAPWGMALRAALPLLATCHRTLFRRENMSQSQSSNPRFVPLYGVTIHKCIAGGDLQKMKDLCAEAEQHVATYGDVSAALEVLKSEIAKAEAKGG
jgi:hypothetical protein